MSSKLTLQEWIILLVVTVVVSALGITNFFIIEDVTESTQNNINKTAQITSQLVAESTIIKEGLNGGDEAAIQRFAEKVRRQSGADFITVFDENGIRKSHPNPEMIGKVFQGGDEGPVLSGQEHRSTAEGSLGLSVRYFTPVFSNNNEVIGAVAVGITLEKIQEAVAASRETIYAGVAAGLLLGLFGAFYLARRIRKIMFGLEPVQIAHLLEERSVMLESTHEGIVAIDRTGTITLVNEAATRLLRKAGLQGPFQGQPAKTIMPHILFDDMLETGSRIVDEDLEINGSFFFINSSPLIVNDRIIGAITTIRDKTEVKKLAERLSGTEMYVQALRAQTHEFMNRLHVILGMVQMKKYDMLLQYIQEINVRYQDNIGYLSKRIQDPILAGFLLAKMSFASEQGKKIHLAEESFLPDQKNSRIAHELITILGNLIDNALEAIDQNSRPVTVFIGIEDGELIIEVKDHGHGIEQPERIFEKGYSEKGENRGYGLFLVKQSVTALDGDIHVLSEKGKGTIMEVTLPLNKKEERK